MNNCATISPMSERYEDWIKVFGTDQVPIINTAFPETVNVCGVAREVYMLDLDKLSEEQLDKLIAHLSTRFSIPVEEVKRDLPLHGVPLLAEELMVTTDQMFFL